MAKVIGVGEAKSQKQTIHDPMDAEISALEARLAKTRELKQGMMQELLMGKLAWSDAFRGRPCCVLRNTLS